MLEGGSELFCTEGVLGAGVLCPVDDEEGCQPEIELVVDDIKLLGVGCGDTECWLPAEGTGPLLGDRARDGALAEADKEPPCCC